MGYCTSDTDEIFAVLITKAKETIREQYPDEEVAS